MTLKNTHSNLEKYLSFRNSILLLGIFLLLNHLFDLDRNLAIYYYSQEGFNWSLQNNFWLQQVIHNGGRDFSVGLCILLIVISLLSCCVNFLAKYRYTFLYVLSSVLISGLLVGLLKHQLLVSCPWEFSLFGGDLQYLSLLNQLLVRNGDGCFPSGHATAGFTWLAVYWALQHHHSRYSSLGFHMPALIGFIFGFEQQLRGAHFISHDVTSFFICWTVPTLLYKISLGNELINNKWSLGNSILRNDNVS